MESEKKKQIKNKTVLENLFKLASSGMRQYNDRNKDECDGFDEQC